MKPRTCCSGVITGGSSRLADLKKFENTPRHQESTRGGDDPDEDVALSPDHRRQAPRDSQDDQPGAPDRSCCIAKPESRNQHRRAEKAVTQLGPCLDRLAGCLTVRD